MAATATIDTDGRGSSGDSFSRRGKVTVGVYATNGVAVAKADFDLAVMLESLHIFPSAGYVPEWDKTNAKVKVYRQTNPAAAGGADIPLVEVANAVDLSAVLFRFEAIGK